jgi:hypothetical protein
VEWNGEYRGQVSISYAYENPCGSTSTSEPLSVNVFNSTGMDEQLASRVEVYPNPATTVLNIQADGLQKVELMDMGGRRIITTTQPQLNIGQLPRGAYFVRITTANSTTVKRVVKK